MALNPQLAAGTVNAMADALSVLLDNGYLRIYDGVQPATADDAITTQVLLAELRFNADAFPSAIDGVLTANLITADASANASGTASWARLLKSNGSTVVMDGTVGTSDANVIITTTTIVAGNNVAVSQLVITVPKSGETLAEDAGGG
jgi:hypothetical protein